MPPLEEGAEERDGSSGADVGVVVFAEEVEPFRRETEGGDPVFDRQRGSGRLVVEELEGLEGDWREELVGGLPPLPGGRGGVGGRPFLDRLGQGITQSLDRIVQMSTLATATITTIYLVRNINN